MWSVNIQPMCKREKNKQKRTNIDLNKMEKEQKERRRNQKERNWKEQKPKNWGNPKTPEFAPLISRVLRSQMLACTSNDYQSRNN
jgi:hypothetical protein